MTSNLFTNAAATTTVINLVDQLKDKTTQAVGPMSSQAASGGGELWQNFLNIDWTNPTWDIIILLFFAATVLVYGFTLGRDRIVAVLISTYLALAVTTNFPYMAQVNQLIKQSGFVYLQVSSFLIIFALLFFFLSRSRLLQAVSTFSGSWWQVVIFSLLQVGLLISIIFSFLDDGTLNRFSPFTQIIFLSDLGRFCWIVLPIIALVFFGGRRRRRRRGLRNLDELDY